MVTTRSRSLPSTIKASQIVAETTNTQIPKKRKAAAPAAMKSPSKSLKTEESAVQPALTFLRETIDSVHVPVLFDYEIARNHMIKTDPRWERIFDTLKCKPYEDVEDNTHVNPFQSLASSILGQQVSWLAARAIRYRFIRVFFPHLPEKLEPSSESLPWPTPRQVAELEISDLRGAGLSTRKSEYILDLARRFADGRLSAEKLVKLSDEELIEELVAIRGIGKWTVEMFLIFTLRRADILPVGDLGIQKGLLKWYTQASPRITLKKLPGSPEKKVEVDTPKIVTKTVEHILSSPPPSPGADTGLPTSLSGVLAMKEAPKTPERKKKSTKKLIPPTPLTPSNDTTDSIPPIPDDCKLTHDVLRARLRKPIKNGLYLTAEEMNKLTRHWAPYRSIGVWYLWSLADGEDA